ncbi:MAG: hypothetical protein KGI78_04185 [Patescibacteria group bacterium]|nr:hypothetical protein [Patescibacteria group bacterium]MDE1944142.1 hypothetical protein [Patescibacteria group bacterium]MDE1944763.1 hypothetical protein [Patescibacteria group bacterium]MDE2058014.1 hypothetical protein [Patescibacteria group bacterium]
MDWKTLAAGIVLIIVLGVGGLVYRNAVEQANRQIACPVDAKVCPDGTAVARQGLACLFPACPPPNVALDAVNLAYAVPPGFAPAAPASVPDDGTGGKGAVLAAYAALPSASSTSADASTTPQGVGSALIVVRSYPIAASSTPLATIEATAISATSGAPVPATGYTSENIGGQRFTIVTIERFEGVVDTAFYLAHGADVIRFDAIDRGADWTNPSLDTSALPAEAALRGLLATLEGA